MIAHIETEWLEAMTSARLYRYELPETSFERLDDAGMWVSRSAVEPLEIEAIDNLPGALQQSNVELRVMDNLLPLRDIWATSLHASGIRLRNAKDWLPPAV